MCSDVAFWGYPGGIYSRSRFQMSDEDGEGRYGSVGINKEEKLWRELC
jgi:hypothetical protein